MTNGNETIHAFCQDIETYLRGERWMPVLPSSAVIEELKSACTDVKGQSLVEKSEKLTALKESVDETLADVEREIGTLIGKGKSPERVADLFYFDSVLYGIRESLHARDNAKFKESYAEIVAALPGFIEKKKNIFDQAESRLTFKIKIAKALRAITPVAGILFFAINYYEYAYAYLVLTLSLLCFTYFFVLEGIWLNALEDKMAKVKREEDLTLPKNAGKFLQPPLGIIRLKTLLDESFFAPLHQKRFADTIVELGIACGWGGGPESVIEELKRTMQIALDDAYSATATQYDPAFLKSWRGMAEELRKEIRECFGGTLATFYKRTKKQPNYFIERLQAFALSGSRDKLHRFLNTSRKYL